MLDSGAELCASHAVSTGIVEKDLGGCEFGSDCVSTLFEPR
jgi:hypothetical protein